MDTAIHYLNEVHGDLLDAAKREHARLRPVQGRSPRWVPSSGLVAAVLAVLVSAGLVGLIVRSGGLGADDEAVSGGETAATGATGATAGAEVPTPAPGNALAPADDEQGGGGGGQAPTLTRIIRTGEIALVIPRDSFDDRFGEAVDVAEEHGGFVADSRSRNRSGSLTLRVPAENFDETLRALRSLGAVQEESIHGKDVTADYVDLRARLRIAKARREVLLGLQADATTIEQTIRVQNELDRTQLDIESIQGQLRVLDDRTSLATIRLDMREEGVEPEAEVETASIPNAFERAVAGFVGVVAAIVIGLGYVLPLVALGLLIWFVVGRIQRRRAS